MAAIGGTNSATQSLQQSLLQSRATQAQREAESAEAMARQRRLEANRAAEQAQTSPATPPRRPAPAAPMDADVYSSPKLASQSEVAPPTQEFLVRMYTAAADKFAAAGNPLKSNPNAPATRNALGQSTSRILDLTV